MDINGWTSHRCGIGKSRKQYMWRYGTGSGYRGRVLDYVFESELAQFEAGALRPLASVGLM